MTFHVSSLATDTDDGAETPLRLAAARPVPRAALRAILGAALLAAACALTACSRAEPEPTREPAEPPPRASAATPAATPAGSAAGSAAAAGPLVLARGVRFVHAPAGDDAAKVVRDERERARSDGRDLVVYVGATWCEPCQHFHRAAQRGELDAEFPDLTILEFDLDADRERLRRAGYVSDFIPLFAMPGADGRASERKFEGSVKGSGAVANIAPRLRKLLAR